MKDNYYIGDLVTELKINKETIRYYERIGLLNEPKRDEAGYRIYSKEDLELIKFILIVKDYGFSLKEISKLIHDEILCGDMECVKSIVEIKLNEINSKIKELEATQRLLRKVKQKLLSQNIECCKDMEINLKNKS